ncbi:MAG TPA: hypothetical protein VEX69_03190 [Candidatus Limnocylindria bacterium]|nr:hypothetical protein [Candidatus Limnocylindria bacterium]
MDVAASQEQNTNVDRSTPEQTLTQSPSSSVAAADKRRSTRVAHVVPVLVRGTDALRNPFKESTTTVEVNCYGCQYQSKHYVQKNTVVTLEIPRFNSKLPPRIARGRAIWVQRPRTYRHLFLVGIEFDIPGNVWSIQSPPKDWFPHPEDEELIIPVYPAAAEQEESSSPLSIALAEISETIPEIHGSSQQTVENAVAAAVAKEMERVRRQIDAHLHEAVDSAVKVLTECITNAAVENVIQQAEDGTIASGEEPPGTRSSKRRRKPEKPKT